MKPTAVVMDVMIPLTPPVYKYVLAMAAFKRGGMDVIFRSYLGRSTTRKLFQKLGLLNYADDFLWNDKPVPETAYEIAGPDDPVFDSILQSALANLRPALTEEVDLGQQNALSGALINPLKEVAYARQRQTQ